LWQNSRPVCYFSFKNWYNKLVSDLMSMLNYTGIVENAALCTHSKSLIKLPLRPDYRHTPLLCIALRDHQKLA
jgi:hypothetical protein